MKSVSINGIARVNLGKKFAKRLRDDENVPCVIYGGDDGSIHFYAHSNEFRKIVYTPSVYLIDIIVGDKKVKAIMRDIQFHPVTDKILHIDFVQIFDNQNIRIKLPVNIVGSAIGVRNGGRLSFNIRKLLAEAVAENLPESIEIDISQLRIGDSVRISDLLFENITFLNNPNDVIVAVKTARAIIEEEEEDVEEEGAEGAEEDETAEGKDGGTEGKEKKGEGKDEKAEGKDKKGEGK